MKGIKKIKRKKNNGKFIYNLFGRHFANQIHHFPHNTRIFCIYQNMLPNRWIELLPQQFSLHADSLRVTVPVSLCIISYDL